VDAVARAIMEAALSSPPDIRSSPAWRWVMGRALIALRDEGYSPAEAANVIRAVRRRVRLGG
jgi:hypothetical protein